MIGTSGWMYALWKTNVSGKQSFYNEKYDFDTYSANFKMVELNCTFYRKPTEKTVKKWKQAAPEGFKYLVKVNKYLTHSKKLLDWEEQFADFHSVTKHLENTLLGYLIQLPPMFSIKQLPRLLKVIEHNRQVYPTIDFYVEFRHPSWFCDTVYDALAFKINIVYIHSAFDLGAGEGFYPKLSDNVQNTKTMFRCHGSWKSKPYHGSYSDLDLTRIASMKPDIVCFDNTDTLENQVEVDIPGKMMFTLDFRFATKVLPSAVADAKKMMMLM